MFKYILAIALISGVTLPVTAKEVGPGLGSSDHVSFRNRGRYGRICTRDFDGSLSLRKGPGQRFKKISEVPNKHYVSLIRGQYSRDGFWWWNVNYNGYNGWSRADYICEDPQ